MQDIKTLISGIFQPYQKRKDTWKNLPVLQAGIDEQCCKFFKTHIHSQKQEMSIMLEEKSQHAYHVWLVLSQSSRPIVTPDLGLNPLVAHS